MNAALEAPAVMDPIRCASTRGVDTSATPFTAPNTLRWRRTAFLGKPMLSAVWLVPRLFSMAGSELRTED